MVYFNIIIYAVNHYELPSGERKRAVKLHYEHIKMDNYRQAYFILHCKLENVVLMDKMQMCFLSFFFNSINSLEEKLPKM